jgi:hypothetical protein
MKILMLASIAAVMVAGTFAVGRGNTRDTAASCNVQGVWKQYKIVVNGKADSSDTGQEVKLVTKTHFAWIQQESRRDTLPLKTFRDSVRVMTDGGGYGTYSLSGSNYTEHIEMFPDPTYLGKDWPATCQTTGSQWIHSWLSPEYKDSTGQNRRDTVTEYLRRIE